MTCWTPATRARRWRSCREWGRKRGGEEGRGRKRKGQGNEREEAPHHSTIPTFPSSPPCSRVHLLEDEEGNIHLRNLSMHPASSEEEALNLLFLGDTNRAIAETPMNMASSRSHCIFTMSIEARQEGSSTIKRSKLHLVDLAG